MTWPLNAENRRHYLVNEIYSTIQGEGYLAGTPMTIIRLNGCDIGCQFCDSKTTWEPGPWIPGNTSSAEEIAAQVDTNLIPRWALVTGGEPCWHDLSALARELRARGLRTALETSGTHRLTGVWTSICVSPKPRGKRKFIPEVLLSADEVKWLIGKKDDVLGLEVFLSRFAAEIKCRSPRISVQPISCSAQATKLAFQAVMTHPTWRLSLQIHKFLGVP